MTLTFTGYDQSQERRDFDEHVLKSKGFITGARYSRQSPAIVTLTAFVPEQLSLNDQLHPVTPPKP